VAYLDAAWSCLVFNGLAWFGLFHPGHGHPCVRSVFWGHFFAPDIAHLRTRCLTRAASAAATRRHRCRRAPAEQTLSLENGSWEDKGFAWCVPARRLQAPNFKPKSFPFKIPPVLRPPSLAVTDFNPTPFFKRHSQSPELRK
jgi:hypothetical protein